jgi:hypothetical protein
LLNYQVVRWVGVSYGGVWGLVVVVVVCVCPIVTPESVWGRTTICIEKLGAVCMYHCPNMLDIV